MLPKRHYDGANEGLRIVPILLSHLRPQSIPESVSTLINIAICNLPIVVSDHSVTAEDMLTCQGHIQAYVWWKVTRL
jgi:hypothetical protein